MDNSKDKKMPPHINKRQPDPPVYEPPNPLTIAKRDIDSLTVGELKNFYNLSNTAAALAGDQQLLPRQNKPSFGEKIANAIDDTMTDSLVQGIVKNMFRSPVDTVAQSSPISMPVEILKVILDSKAAQQAAANLDKIIEATGKTIGSKKAEALADATIDMVKGKTQENEQVKMMQMILNMNPYNIIDVKKFAELVNSNPDNPRLTNMDQARTLLTEEQKKIITNNPQLAQGTTAQGYFENQDIDRSTPRNLDQIMPTSDNFTDAGNKHEMGTEAILQLDPTDNSSVTAFAWSQNMGGLLNEPRGLEKVRNILIRKQDELMKQVVAMGGQPPIQQPLQQLTQEEQPITELPNEEEQSITELPNEEEQAQDNRWNTKDIGHPPTQQDLEPDNVQQQQEQQDLEPDNVQQQQEQQLDQENEQQTLPSEPQNEDMSQIVTLLKKMDSNFTDNIEQIHLEIGTLSEKIDNIDNRVSKIEDIEPIEHEVDNIEDTDIESEQTNSEQSANIELVENEEEIDKSIKEQQPTNIKLVENEEEIDKSIKDIEKDTKDTTQEISKANFIEEPRPIKGKMKMCRLDKITGQILSYRDKSKWIDIENKEVK